MMRVSDGGGNQKQIVNLIQGQNNTQIYQINLNKSTEDDFLENEIQDSYSNDTFYDYQENPRGKATIDMKDSTNLQNIQTMQLYKDLNLKRKSTIEYV